MSATINMKLTTAGRAAIFNAQGTGVQAVLSHVQVGTGRRTPDGSETTMVTPVQTTTIAAGSKPSPTQIRVSCLFPGISNYDMTEIGVWIGNPAAGGVLFAYYSVTTGKIGTMVSGTDFVFAHEWTMDAADAAALNILADTGQSAMLAMMAAHEAAIDPHPQYATDAQLAGLVGTASPTMNGAVAVGTATKYAREDHRHPSDTSKANTTGTYAELNVGYASSAGNAATVGGWNADHLRTWGNLIGRPSDIVYSNGGTYGLNITGSAGYAASAGNADTVDGHHADDFMKRSQVQFYPGDTGYIVMPPDADGRQIIRQWGVTADVSNDQMVSVTFPVTFPHACLHVTPIALSDSGNYDHFALLISKSNTGCVLGRGWITGNSVNKKLQWVAEGW